MKCCHLTALALTAKVRCPPANLARCCLRYGRYEHFDPAYLGEWTRRGYPEPIIREFLNVMKTQVSSPGGMPQLLALAACCGTQGRLSCLLRDSRALSATAGDLKHDACRSLR